MIYPDVSALRLYTYGLGLVSDQVGVSGSRRYFHGDQIGSTRAMTDSAGGTGTLPVTVGYTAFGERLNATGSTLTRYGYAGAHGYQSDGLADSAATVLDDDVLGLLHVGARWYDPAIGRFISRDPIGIAGGLNVYAYCGNSPLAGVDVSGRFSCGEVVTTAAINAVIGAAIGTFGGAMSATGSYLAGKGFSWTDVAAGAAAGAITGAGGGIGIVIGQSTIRGSGFLACAVTAGGGAAGGLVSGLIQGHAPARLAIDAGIGAGLGLLAGWAGLAEAEKAHIAVELLNLTISMGTTAEW